MEPQLLNSIQRHIEKKETEAQLMVDAAKAGVYLAHSSEEAEALIKHCARVASRVNQEHKVATDVYKQASRSSAISHKRNLYQTEIKDRLRDQVETVNNCRELLKASKHFIKAAKKVAPAGIKAHEKSCDKHHKLLERVAELGASFEDLCYNSGMNYGSFQPFEQSDDENLVEFLDNEKKFNQLFASAVLSDKRSIITSFDDGGSNEQFKISQIKALPSPPTDNPKRN